MLARARLQGVWKALPHYLNNDFAKCGGSRLDRHYRSIGQPRVSGISASAAQRRILGPPRPARFTVLLNAGRTQNQEDRGSQMLATMREIPPR